MQSKIPEILRLKSSQMHRSLQRHIPFSRTCEHISKEKRDGIDWTDTWGLGPVHDVNMHGFRSVYTRTQEPIEMAMLHSLTLERNQNKKTSKSTVQRWFCLTQSSTCTCHGNIVKTSEDLMRDSVRALTP
jgi:hypothetical protein